MNTLKIKALSKTYANGTSALSDISLTITDGLFGLLGPNGAGKSTLMRTLAALQKPTCGEIHFNTIDILKKPRTLKSQLGYLPQEFGVYPKLSAYHLLDHLAILKGVLNRKQRKEQVESLLHQTNLYANRNKAVSSFSGGMKQRFGIAQALLGTPKLIIVDEPTAGLDPEERNRFHDLLSDIASNIIVILSTHIVEDVRHLCSNMAILNQGKLIAQGQPQELISTLQGKVWHKTIDKHDLPSYQSTLPVISSKLIAGKTSIHVLSDSCPESGFEATPADLEDVYFSQLQQSQTI